MIIYKATNKVNGKVYIGQTTKTLKERMNSHKKDSLRMNTYFYRAIRKYGWDNFEWEIIDESATTIEELNRLEQYYIKLYDSFDNKQKGYNTQSGGKNYQMTAEECLKRSERVKGENNPMYGKEGTWKNKHFSEEHRRRISESLKGKPKDSIKGSKNPSAKTIINLTTGEKFGCIKDACQTYNISNTSIVNSAKNHISTQGNFWAFEDDIYDITGKEKKSHSKKVKNIETNQIFNSISEASIAFGCARKGIRDTCNGLRETFKNYHWEYVE